MELVRLGKIWLIVKTALVVAEISRLIADFDPDYN